MLRATAACSGVRASHVTKSESSGKTTSVQTRNGRPSRLNLSRRKPRSPLRARLDGVK